MKKTILGFGALTAIGMIAYSFIFGTKNVMHPALNKSFYELSIKTLDGKKSINLSDFKGKKILCVNTASECGYTKQYEGLQKLSEQYKNKLVIIGFPCNQFGGQEPGSKEEISTFCKKNYGVTFLLTEKIDVKGSNQHPIYQWLCQKSNNGVADYEVKWNFNKFLINESGKLVAYYPSSVKPESDELAKAINN
ncbi:MAG: glutathione peroxidase [Bacteroidetes bacterium]|nr:MAG: glutathione peroxidase [Bacteroidota bacterium]